MGRDPSVAKNIQFDYIQDSAPSGPGVVEGVSWLDTNADELKVYDGANWFKTGIVDHSNLTNVASGQHHTRYADSEARTAVDGANVSITGDADTVDGKHASEISGLTTADFGFENGSVSYGYTDQKYSVSFANTYQKATPSFGFHAQYQDDTPMRGARFTGWNTNANGNITGMTYFVQNADGDNIDITWTVFGVKI